MNVIFGGTLARPDQQFVTMVAKSDMTEAHKGQLAQDQGTRSDIKEFAKTIVKDHTESYQQLTGLAAKVSVSIPKGINAAKEPTIVHLVHMKGANFDRQFVQDEIVSNRRMIAAFRREVAHGTDADVKSYADKMIPILEKQLRVAEDLAKPGQRI
jgi:putative membrane protein